MRLKNIAIIIPNPIPIHDDISGRYICPTAKLTKKGDHKTAVFIPRIDASPADCLKLICEFLGSTDDKSGKEPMFITLPRK